MNLQSIARKLLVSSFLLTREEKDQLLAEVTRFSQEKLLDFIKKLKESKEEEKKLLTQLPPQVLLQLKQKIFAIRRATIERAQKRAAQDDAELAEKVLAE